VSVAPEGGVAEAADARGRILARASGGVLSSIAALCDPQLAVLGGPWGGQPAVVGAVRTAAIGLRGPSACAPPS
jgi:hypothetical protein